MGSRVGKSIYGNEEEGECACIPFILFMAHGKPTVVGGSN